MKETKGQWAAVRGMLEQVQKSLGEDSSISSEVNSGERGWGEKSRNKDGWDLLCTRFPDFFECASQMIHLNYMRC